MRIYVYVTYYLPVSILYFLYDLRVEDRAIKYYCLSACYDFLLDLSRLILHKQNAPPFPPQKTPLFWYFQYFYV
jgi:hypothetical protein